MKKIIFIVVLAILWQSCDREKSEREETANKRKAVKIQRKEARVQRRDSLQYSFGRDLFEVNCAPCHSTTHEIIVGPGLAGVTKRLPRKQIIRWIKNSNQLLEEGDPYAVKLFKQYNNTPMPKYRFTDNQLKALLYYLQETEQRGKTGA